MVMVVVEVEAVSGYARCSPDGKRKVMWNVKKKKVVDRGSGWEGNDGKPKDVGEAGRRGGGGGSRSLMEKKRWRLRRREKEGEGL